MMENRNNIENNVPPIPPYVFSIIDAVRRAFQFIIVERQYLARLSVPVIILQLGLSIALFMYDKDASNFTHFLILMPATVFMGWFNFSIIRLIIFGERRNNLPIKDVRFMQYRANLMKASILMFILFKAGSAVVAELAFKFSQFNRLDDTIPPLILLAIFGGGVILFWALRLFVVPLLVAVDYPIKLFLRQARGFIFSLKLFALMFLSALPSFFLLNIIAMMIIKTPSNISDTEIMLLTAVQAPFIVIISATICAASVFALKEMLGENKIIRDLGR